MKRPQRMPWLEGVCLSCPLLLQVAKIDSGLAEPPPIAIPDGRWEEQEEEDDEGEWEEEEEGGACLLSMRWLGGRVPRCGGRA